MMFLNINTVLVQLALASAALAATCCPKPASCSSICTQAAASSRCAKSIAAQYVPYTTCTTTKTKPYGTETAYVKSGKTTCTHWKTTTCTKTTSKTISTKCTVTSTKVSTKTTTKSATATSTKLNTINVKATSFTTVTTTVTTTTTIVGAPPVRFARRGNLPASCSCFLTRTKTATKTGRCTTKTVKIPSGTVNVTKTTGKTVTTTKTIAKDVVSTKYVTSTAIATTTKTSTSTKTINNTSTTSTLTSTSTVTVTDTVTSYMTRPTVTFTSTTLTTSITTITPPGTAPVTVITYVPQPTVTVTTEGPESGTITLSPTNSLGSTITDGTGGTVTVRITDVPGVQVTTTITQTGPSAYTTTIFVTDNTGSTITTSGTVTVIDFIPVTTTTETFINSVTSVTTITPPGGVGTFSVITYVVQPTVTLTYTSDTAFTTTVFPTDSTGHTFTYGDQGPGGTVTVDVYVTTTIPATTTTETLINSVTSITTITPSGGVGTFSVITYVVQPTVTLTYTSDTAFTTTVFPTDSTGHTFTYGDQGPGGTVTVDVYVTTTIPATTTTETLINSVTSITTITPSGGVGTFSVITYVVQPTVTLTYTSDTAFTPTVFPTDSTGHTFTYGDQGPGGTVTVDVYVTTTIPATTTTETLINSVTSITTITPSGGVGTFSVITYVVQPTITITQTGTTEFTTTLFPTDSTGHTYTYGDQGPGGTVTVDVYVTTPIPATTTTETLINSVTSITTITPPGGTGTFSVITYVVQPTVTVTSITDFVSTTTVFPTDSVGHTYTYGDMGPGGTVTVIDYLAGTTVITDSTTTTTETLINSVTSITTITPPGGIGTFSVITYVVQPTVTVTSITDFVSTTTVFPTNSAGHTYTYGDMAPGGTVTVIDYLAGNTVTYTEPTVTITTEGPTAGTTTEFPTDSAGSTIATGTVTVVVTITPQPAQPTTTITLVGTSVYTTTIYVTGPSGTTITTSGTVTVIDFITPTATNTFPCSKDGYYLGLDSLYDLNLDTGVLTPLVRNFTTDDQQANCLGYNILDNYLYAIQPNTSSILRIDSDGVVTKVGSVAAGNYNMGDFDNLGQYWVGYTDGPWSVINLNPLASGGSYGAVVESGTFTIPANGFVADWAYIPSAGRFLYAMSVLSDSSGTLLGQQLIKFDMTAHTWSNVSAVLDLPDDFADIGYGAVFADNDGTFYFTGVNTQKIYSINVFDPTTIKTVASTPDDGLNSDGARCVYYDDYDYVARPIVTLTTTGAVAGTFTEVPAATTDPLTVVITNVPGPTTTN
ncbi:hypothetical protein AA313_de0204934 [Arthrobotrys entomopaga]|nr:hypothetical protein AA313_de0204934 [Arthrobotrys entomopaga]